MIKIGTKCGIHCYVGCVFYIIKEHKTEQKQHDEQNKRVPQMYFLKAHFIGKGVEAAHISVRRLI